MNRYERRSSIWLAFLKKKEIEPAPSGISIPFSRSSISISLSSPSLILPDENELTPSLRRARIRSFKPNLSISLFFDPSPKCNTR